MKRFLFLILFGNVSGIAQNNNELMDKASYFQKGIFNSYNPDTAFNLYLKEALKGDIVAMNAVGVHYAKGLGVDSNFNSALNWFINSANGGYSKSYVNIGMLYKHRNKDSSDFIKACNYFDSALLLNDNSALFAKGYMLYKGLGCTQNYYAAFALFLEGANIGRTDCLYFSGLCYKNGFGTSADTALGNAYIKEAARLGYRQAIKEIRLNTPENTDQENSGYAARGFQNETSIKPTKLKPVDTYIPSKISGVYEGIIQQFDYSGKHVLQQTKLQINLERKDNVISGLWIENDNNLVNIRAYIKDNEVIFEPISYQRLNNREVGKRTRKLQFSSAKLRWSDMKDSVLLIGNIYMKDIKRNEPYKPLYIHLIRKDDFKDFNYTSEKIKPTIFPNPTKRAIYMCLNAFKKQQLQVLIFNLKGQCVYTSNHKNIDAGLNTIMLDLNLQPGNYLVKYLGVDKFETNKLIIQ